MEFTITEYKHCDLIEISGRIDSYTAPQIEQALKSLMSDNRYNIVVDLQNVDYLSSAGILIFVNAQKIIRQLNHGEIIFSNVPKNVFSGFELAGFNTLFDYYEDTASAVGRF